MLDLVTCTVIGYDRRRKHDRSKPTVLVADGSKAILRIMARILERNGYFVVAAETGSEAEKLETHICDAALLSSELSDMDLTTLLRKIHEKAPNILKIVLTNSPLSKDTFEVAQGDVWAFLVKPVKPEVILSILEENLKKKWEKRIQKFETRLKKMTDRVIGNVFNQPVFFLHF